MGFPVAAAPPDKPSERQVAGWIEELGNEDFGKREKASRQLWLAGEAAEAALENALQGSDPEVVRRARAVLDKFRWGIYGDTPSKVVALIQAYKAVDVEDGFDGRSCHIDSGAVHSGRWSEVNEPRGKGGLILSRPHVLLK